MEEENGVRTRSFRHEAYYNRRVFLRSYPLQWEREEEESNNVEVEEEDEGKGVLKGWKRGVKERFMTVFHELGGDECKFSLLLSKLRDKDYCKWRVFLRRYPIQWGSEEEGNDVEMEEEEEQKDKGKGMLKGWKKGAKERFMAAFHELGEDEFKFSLLLSNLRDKVAFYLITCNALRYHRPRFQFLRAAY